MSELEELENKVEELKLARDYAQREYVKEQKRADQLALTVVTVGEELERMKAKAESTFGCEWNGKSFVQIQYRKGD